MNYLNNIQTIFTILIGCIVAYVAYQQFKTNRDKLRFDLFEKRFSVFEALSHLFIQVQALADVNQDGLSQVQVKMLESKFLFNDEIYEYLKLCHKRALKLMFLNKKLNNQNSLLEKKERERVADEILEVTDWLLNQPERSVILFNKYLKFTTQG